MKTNEFMTIDELKRIAEENDYELSDSLGKYRLTHKYCENHIVINEICANRLWISIPMTCDDRDFNMIKAAVKFAETPPDEREEETYYLVKFSEKEIEAIKKKFNTDFSDFELVEVEE